MTTKRMFELFIGFMLVQILTPDKNLESQLGPLPEHEKQFIKALLIEDTAEWILSKVEKNYSLRNKV